jgi:pimeloyl-ACP methyl ester carboxylesterase
MYARRMTRLRRIAVVVALAAVVAATSVLAAPARARADDPFLPPPVVVAQEPQGVQLADPAFTALPGAKAYYGRLGGAVYEIEIPDNWNGRLVLYMHGFQGLSSHARVEQPSLRDYLIRNGFAWGATSASSTSLIPGREADETAALWDMFVRRFRRPKFTYVTGHSMGGAATNIAAERYGDRFDGALGLCGFAGQTAQTNMVADYFVAGAYVAGVTQAEYESAEIGPLIRDRILPALANPDNHTTFEHIMIDLTGGPRALDDEGFRLEEMTNWERARILVSARIASNEGRTYQLGPLAPALTADFNARALRLRATKAPWVQAYYDGNELTGRLQMPLLTMHTTGDWQVPIDEQQTLRRIVDAAGSGGMLVQRVVRDEKHCGFTNAEWAQGLNDLMGWVERGQKPGGDDVMVRDLANVGTTYTLTPRAGTNESWLVPHESDRVTLSGTITLDGEPLRGAYVGVIVRRGRFATDCTYQLEPVFDGTYRRYLPGEAELAGCGGPGAKVYVWAMVGGKAVFSQQALDWPGPGWSSTFDVTMSRSDPGGANGPAFAVYGDALDDHGQPLPVGTRIEARAGSAVCAAGDVAPVARVAYVTYVLIGVQPAPAGCGDGTTLRFYIHGRPSRESAILHYTNGITQLFINQAP